MATFEYQCPQCKPHYEVIKSINECSREELCPVHNMVMTRVWTVPRMTMHEIRDHLKTSDGRELVAVGNEREALRKIQPKRQEYELPREVLSTFED